MDKWEIYLFWLALVLYIFSWLGLVAEYIFLSKRFGGKEDTEQPVFFRLLSRLPWLALSVHAVSLGIRAYLAGHLPLFGTYENAQVACWFVFFFTVLIRKYGSTLRYVGIITYLWGIGLFLWALRFNPHRIPLTISERSLWVDVHVLFAWLAFGSFLLAAGLSFMIIGEKKAKITRMSLIPLPMLAALHFKYLTFGFVTYSVMITLGAYYSFLLFNRWWQWDIVETLSLINWLLYGLIIHLRLFYRERLKLAAWLTLLSPLGLLVAYLGLSAINVNTFHNFDLPF